jgi:hypothetical protein
MDTTTIDALIKTKAQAQAETDMRDLRNLIHSWQSTHPTAKPDQSGWLDFHYSNMRVNDYAAKSLKGPNAHTHRETINKGLSSLMHYYQTDRVNFLISEMTADLLSKVSLLG